MTLIWRRIARTPLMLETAARAASSLGAGMVIAGKQSTAVVLRSTDLRAT
jgi:hypothetical protein